jgi:hypothetical protein
MPSPGGYAFIDEAGQRAVTAKSSDHFVMSAVVVKNDERDGLSSLLVNLRERLAGC